MGFSKGFPYFCEVSVGYVRASHGPKHNESLLHKRSDFMRFYSHFQSDKTLSLNL